MIVINDIPFVAVLELVVQLLLQFFVDEDGFLRSEFLRLEFEHVHIGLGFVLERGEVRDKIDVNNLIFVFLNESFFLRHIII